VGLHFGDLHYCYSFSYDWMLIVLMNGKNIA
jgi:hypothetical protein